MLFFLQKRAGKRFDVMDGSSDVCVSDLKTTLECPVSHHAKLDTLGWYWLGPQGVQGFPGFLVFPQGPRSGGGGCSVGPHRPRHWAGMCVCRVTDERGDRVPGRSVVCGRFVSRAV